MLQEIPGFLTHEQGQSIIEKYKDTFSQVSVYGTKKNTYRTADQTKLSTKDPVVKNMIKAIADITGTPIKNQEFPVIVKYSRGGEYKRHYDFFSPGRDYTERELARGGQRSKTALIYLNDDYRGGCTHFPKMNKLIHPQRGKLIVWDNIYSDGSLDINSLHSGLPVKEGIKYIVVVWIRERIFG